MAAPADISSKDMKTWTKHSHILTTNDVSWAKGAMWAPDAHEVDGKYYLFFSANDLYPQSGRREDGEPQKEAKLQGYGGIGVAVAERPEGPYRDLVGKPLIDCFWNRAQPIDQCVFKHKGEWYMVYGGWGRCNLVKLAKGTSATTAARSQVRGVIIESFASTDCTSTRTAA